MYTVIFFIMLSCKTPRILNFVMHIEIRTMIGVIN